MTILLRRRFTYVHCFSKPYLVQCSVIFTFRVVLISGGGFAGRARRTLGMKSPLVLREGLGDNIFTVNMIHLVFAASSRFPGHRGRCLRLAHRPVNGRQSPCAAQGHPQECHLLLPLRCHVHCPRPRRVHVLLRVWLHSRYVPHMRRDDFMPRQGVAPSPISIAALCDVHPPGMFYMADIGH